MKEKTNKFYRVWLLACGALLLNANCLFAQSRADVNSSSIGKKAERTPVLYTEEQNGSRAGIGVLDDTSMDNRKVSSGSNLMGTGEPTPNTLNIEGKGGSTSSNGTSSNSLSITLPEITTNVAGTIYASNLVENDNIVLTGNTVLFMNTDLTLTSISGDYTLEIQGSNTLTVNNPNGKGINVKSLNSMAPLNVTAKENAIITTSAAGDITISADLTAETTGSTYYCVVGRNVSLNDGTMSITSVTNAVVSYGNITLSGDITVSVTDKLSGALNPREGGNLLIKDGSTVNAISAGFGIYADGGITMEGGTLIARGYSSSAIEANTGAISLSGTINAKGEKNAIYAANKTNGNITVNGNLTAETTGSEYVCVVGRNVSLNGGTMSITSVTNAVVSYGNITLSGDITVSVTDKLSGALNPRDGGNLLIKDGSTINAISAGFGIYADGGITMEGGTLIARGYSSYAIAANTGAISLTGTINAKGEKNAIYAANKTNGNITVNGNLTAETTGSEYYCIVGKDVTLNGGTISVTSVTNAVISNGDMTLSGDITATSTGSGSVAVNSRDGGNITVTSGRLIAVGKGYGIYANGMLSLTSPLMVVSPSDGGISADGHTVVDDESAKALRAVIMLPPIYGSVALSSEPAPGESVGFTLSGDVASAQTENIWQISDDGSVWSDIDGATESTYQPTAAQINKYLRVRVAAVDHTGYIYSPSRQIAKKLCTGVPVVPTLTNINDKVYVSNAKTTQEYIIFTTSKDVSSLTESDWADAVTPESEVGFFELNSATNANNIVFTRIKETTSTLASEAVAESRLYIGTSVYLTDVDLSVSKTVGYFQNINNELNCKVGDVIRCDAKPVPSNATNWYGISGSNWTVDYHNTGSAYGTFYEDEDCTVPISSSTNYTTVYLKTLAEKNYLDVRILAYNSNIGYKTRYVQFNVTPDGYFPSLDYISGCSRTIAAGERLTDIEVGRRPLSGSVYGLTTQVSGEGTAPIVSFTLYERMNVNATNATPGVYTYTPVQNGTPMTGSAFTITVTDGKYGVDAVLMREKEITADPSETIELVAQLMPANSEADIQWTSSNASVATVLDGIVTIADDAPIGAVATITATADGKSDECVITVSGEEYDLYVASTRVTSRNRDDILSDGKFSFDGMRTLSINGDYTISGSANLVRNTGIDGLYIDVAQACTISQDAESYSTLFDLRKNTTICGEQMTVNGNGVAFSTQGGMILTLSDANLVVNAIMPFKGSTLTEDRLNIINSHLEVNASGSAAIDYFSGGIELYDCAITTPVGGYVDGSTIVNGSGAQARNVIIRPQISLYDEGDNELTIASYAESGQTTDVKLEGRTFSKDGAWNTLCLPFDVATLTGTPLEGATIMEMNTAKKNGLDEATGTLYLSFKTATEIEAGKPYLVKWDSGEDIVDPVFTDVTITGITPTAVTSTTTGLTEVTMTGNYAPIDVEANDQSIMFMGDANTLYYTTVDRTLRNFRAHFEIESQNQVNSFVMDFDGEGIATDISLTDPLPTYPREGIYTLDGRKIDGKPTKKGIYVSDGRKVVIE